MKKINFQGLPNTDTPLSPNILNEMQSNIEESCVIVSPTEPTTNEKVWIQKGKNLSKVNKIDRVNSGGSIIKINVKENTNYTISAIKTRIEGATISNLNIHGVGSVKAYDRLGNELENLFRDNAHYLEKGSCKFDFEITTPSNCAYIVIDFGNNNGDENLNITVTEIQAEEGPATEYEAYIEKKILCKNDNGVFEEFYKNEDTGWIDLSQYVNSHVVSIRNGYPPMARKINNIVYLRGEVYISTEPQTMQFNILESLPSSLIPSYQVTGGGTTYEDLRNYAIWTENGIITVYIENKSVQSEYKGFDLCNISPYIVD